MEVAISLEAGFLVELGTVARLIGNVCGAGIQQCLFIPLNKPLWFLRGQLW